MTVRRSYHDWFARELWVQQAAVCVLRHSCWAPAALHCCAAWLPSHAAGAAVAWHTTSCELICRCMPLLGCRRARPDQPRGGRVCAARRQHRVTGCGPDGGQGAVHHCGHRHRRHRGQPQQAGAQAGWADGAGADEAGADEAGRAVVVCAGHQAGAAWQLLQRSACMLGGHDHFAPRLASWANQVQCCLGSFNQLYPPVRSTCPAHTPTNLLRLPSW